MKANATGFAAVAHVAGVLDSGRFAAHRLGRKEEKPIADGA